MMRAVMTWPTFAFLEENVWFRRAGRMVPGGTVKSDCDWPLEGRETLACAAVPGGRKQAAKVRARENLTRRNPRLWQMLIGLSRAGTPVLRRKTTGPAQSVRRRGQ